MSRSRNTIRGGKFVKPATKSRTSKIPMKGQTNAENAVGYCHNKTHFGYMTPNLIKVHSCLGKKCPFLEKYEDKTYWIKRDIKKALSKVHSQENLMICFDDIEMDTDNLDTLVDRYRNLMKNDSKPVISTKHKHTKSDL